MKPNHDTEEPGRSRWGLMLLFLAAGVLVMSVGLTFAALIPSGLRLFSQGVVIAGFLAAALASYQSIHLRSHWRLALAYATACCTLVISGYTGDWVVALTGTSLETPRGLAALKLGEDAAIVSTIVVVAFVTRDDPEELYLSRGRFRLGLTIGISSFLVLAVIRVVATAVQGVPPDRVRELLPVFVPVVLADGFMEELLFRGLFLKRMGRVLGEGQANAVTAAVFAFAHVQVTFAASLPAFLVVVFLLGLLWGWIMQRTGSWLAPSLVHAGVDMLIIADMFAAYGAEI